MRTFQLSLTAMLLLGLTTMAFAQNNLDAARRQMYEDIVKQGMRYDLLNGHNANLGVVQFLGNDYFREGIGISEEQRQKIHKEVLGTSMYDHVKNELDYISLMDKLENEFNPWHPNATTETLEKFAALHMERDEMVKNKHLSLFYGNLTADQIQKVNEFHISYMSETEFVFPGMFEALGLSDEQKQQLDNVQNEIMPELDKHIEKQLVLEAKRKEKMDEILKNVTDQKERERLQFHDIDTTKKVWDALQTESNEVKESGKKLADSLKIKMFDVLTDEQWERLIKLTDDPPEYIKKLLEQQRKWKEASDDADSKPEAWAPGPNSWKPGDPIPEGYRQQRQERGRFPRVNQSE